jgi:hypothetical protein
MKLMLYGFVGGFMVGLGLNLGSNAGSYIMLWLHGAAF